MIDNLTSEEINILKFINKNVYTDRAEAFRIFSLTSDYSLNHLLELDLLREIPSKNSDDLPWFAFTPKGQAFINNYEIIENQKEIEFQRLQKESLFSRKIAILSLVVSIISVITQILIA